MPTVTAFPSTPANSYQTIAAITIYADGSVNGGDWLAAEELEQQRAAIEATRIIDRENWAGGRTSPTQDLAFPRTGLSDKEGVALADDQIPPDILAAHSELSMALVSSAGARSGAGTADNVKSITTNKSRVEFFKPGENIGDDLPDVVQDLAGHLLEYNNVSLAGTAYGTDADDNESQFEDREKFYRDEPLG